MTKSKEAKTEAEIEQAHRREIAARIREHLREIDQHKRSVEVLLVGEGKTVGQKPMTKEEALRAVGL